MEVEGIAELPASSNPLSETLVLQTLQSYLSGRREALVTTQAQLGTWQTQHGYHAILQQIVTDKQRVDQPVRLAAIIQLKNGVDRYWRRGALNAVTDDEKQQIREGLLRTAVNEEDRHLAKMMCVVPGEDQDTVVNQLIASITNGLDARETYGGSPIRLRRSLLILLYLFKEVSQNRIGPGRSRLKSYSSQLLTVLSSVYFGSLSAEVIQQELPVQSQWPVLEIRLEDALLSIKIMRRICVMFIDSIPTDSNVPRIWHESLSIFQSVLDTTLSLQQHDKEDSLVINYLHRNLNQIAKLHVSMVKDHPSSFVVLQQDYEVLQMHWRIVCILGQKYALAAGYPPVTQVTSSVNDFDETRKTLIDKLGHQSLLLLRACVKLIGVKGRGLRFRTEGEKQADRDASSVLLEKVFTESGVIELISHIVSELLLFQPNDLREWEEEPDEWEKREELHGEDFEFALLKMLEAVTAPNFDSLLQKEAVYTAVGICAPFLDPLLNFKTLLTDHLVPEVQIPNPEFKILRRRIAILVGQWSVIEDSKGCRPLYFQLFQFLLNPQDPINDQVVRVTAGTQLYHAVNAWETKPEEFLPYVDDTMNRIIRLIEEVDLPETRVRLLNTVNALVARMEDRVSPYVDDLLHALSRLWGDAGDEHLMKQIILGVITHVFLGIVTPHSLHYALLDDALDLWCCIVRNTPTPKSPAELDSDLMSLLPFLLPLMDHEADTFEKGIDILNAYTLLAPSAVINQMIFPNILTSFNMKMGRKVETSAQITLAVELVWQAVIQAHGEEAVMELYFQIRNTGFFDCLVKGLRESYEAHQTSGPNARTTKIQGYIETDYWVLLSHLAYRNPQQFMVTLESSPNSETPADTTNNPNRLRDVDLLMQWVLDEWFLHADDIATPSRKKVVALGLTRLLDLDRPFIALTHHVQSLMSLWTSLVLELTEDSDNKSADCLFLTFNNGPAAAAADDAEAGAASASPDDERMESLRQSDVVRTVNLLEAIRAGLSRFIERFGGQEAFREQVLVNVDAKVVEDFAALGIM